MTNQLPIVTEMFDILQLSYTCVQVADAVEAVEVAVLCRLDTVESEVSTLALRDVRALFMDAAWAVVYRALPAA